MIQQSSFTNDSLGKLYLVPTPIGNLDDMTFRAVKILETANIILAEDTRNTIKLLNHFNIQTQMHSFHEHSREKEADRWIERLVEGVDIALVSDAGMPLINDPGQILVDKALQAQVPVVALPGANAALTALVASGLPSEQFTYYGFFPRSKKDHATTLKLVGQRKETAIFYESPYRLKETLKSIIKILGEQSPTVIGRELTKRYEEYLRGTASEVLEHLQDKQIKGECVLLIGGGQLPEETGHTLDNLSYKEQVEILMASRKIAAKEAIKEVAKINDVRKQSVYDAYHGLE